MGEKDKEKEKRREHMRAAAGSKSKRNGGHNTKEYEAEENVHSLSSLQPLNYLLFICT